MIDPFSKDHTKESINGYFSELRSEIIAQIDVAQAAMNEKVDKLWNFTDMILG